MKDGVMRRGVMRRGVMRHVDESQPGPVRERKLTQAQTLLYLYKKNDVAMSWT